MEIDCSRSIFVCFSFDRINYSIFFRDQVRPLACPSRARIAKTRKQAKVSHVRSVASSICGLWQTVSEEGRDYCLDLHAQCRDALLNGGGQQLELSPIFSVVDRGMTDDHV